MSEAKQTYADLSSEEQALISRYEGMGAEVKSIKPLWNREGQQKGKVIEVSPERLVKSCHDLAMPYNPVFNNDARDVWFARNLEKWQNGIAVNPPNVELDSEGRIIITDGKHRAILAYALGEATFPIEVPAGDADRISAMLG